jgi:hypothetical protein
MLTKTVRSRFNHEIGHKVEGCTIVEKRVIIPPDPAERRLGVYDYLVEVPPVAFEPQRTHAPKSRVAHAAPGLSPIDYTRSTPDQRPGGSIRRLPSR